jgi:hypothetical protein
MNLITFKECVGNAPHSCNAIGHDLFFYGLGVNSSNTKYVHNDTYQTCDIVRPRFLVENHSSNFRPGALDLGFLTCVMPCCPILKHVSNSTSTLMLYLATCSRQD